MYVNYATDICLLKLSATFHNDFFLKKYSPVPENTQNIQYKVEALLVLYYTLIKHFVSFNVK